MTKMIAGETFKCTFCPNEIAEGSSYETVFDRIDLETITVTPGDPACGECFQKYLDSAWN